MTRRVAILLGVFLLAGSAWARPAVIRHATMARLLAQSDGPDILVSALRLQTSVCSLAAPTCGDPADGVLAGEVRFQMVVP